MTGAGVPAQPEISSSKGMSSHPRMDRYFRVKACLRGLWRGGSPDAVEPGAVEADIHAVGREEGVRGDAGLGVLRGVDEVDRYRRFGWQRSICRPRRPAMTQRRGVWASILSDAQRERLVKNCLYGYRCMYRW